MQLLESFGDDLATLFIVSGVKLSAGGDELKVVVNRADGEKCERCWTYTDDIGKNDAHPSLCGRCSAVIG